MNKQIKVVAATVFFITTAWFSHAEIAFSGFAGAKADFYSSDTSDFDPALNFQSFFSGQLSFNKNVILNAEFSLQTEDIIENLDSNSSNNSNSNNSNKETEKDTTKKN